MDMKEISVIDSHTGGEPTRIIIADGPELGTGSIVEKAARFEKEFESVRNAVIGEPRGSEIMVGGLLCEASEKENVAGVIFFDNAGLLGMCGHGTIGFSVTLHHLGRIGIGAYTIETPVGTVHIEMLNPNLVRLKNVASYRSAADVRLNVPGYGEVVGDVAWGGNWFFITNQSPVYLELKNSKELLRYTHSIRDQLVVDGITGDQGHMINHIEIQGPASSDDANARNFVLCPGGAYDRSPCGTGTSAKLACLAADGKLGTGENWRQESIVGSVFDASYQADGDKVIPILSGSAYICGETELIINPADPFRYGIPA